MVGLGFQCQKNHTLYIAICTLGSFRVQAKKLKFVSYKKQSLNNANLKINSYICCSRSDNPTQAGFNKQLSRDGNKALGL